MSTARTLMLLACLAGCDIDRPPPTIQPESKTVETIPATTVVIPPVEESPVVKEFFKVIGIIDGDTIDVLTIDPRTLAWQRDGIQTEERGGQIGSKVDQFAPETIRLRLNGIDTPENGQPFGKNAKQFLSQTIGGKMVRIVKHDVDRYGRTIADVFLRRDAFIRQPDMFLNRELVKRGLAWHYKQYSDDEGLARDEEEARAAKLGLWSDPRHVAPWDWRKLLKVERDKLR